MNINHIVLEAINATYNPTIHRQLNANNTADNVGKYINIGSLVAALYHIYSAAKNSKGDKISAAINSIPSAAMKAFAIAMSGHAIKDLARGNYQPPQNHLSAKAPNYVDSMIRKNSSNLNNKSK